MKQNIYHRYLGQNVESNSHSGVVTVLKNHKMAIVTATDYETGEDSEHSSKAAKIIIDSFMKRPCIEDKAIEGISALANDGLFIEAKSKQSACSVGALFILKGKARWFVTGGAMVYHFENGVFSRCSDDETMAMGIAPQFKVGLEDAVDIRSEENAFLVCSRELPKLITPEELSEALKVSNSPEEWIENILKKTGEDKQFCMNAVFLPSVRRTLFGRK